VNERPNGVAFEPARLGRRRPAGPVVIVVVIVVVGLVLAIVKPWGTPAPSVAVLPSPIPAPPSLVAGPTVPPGRPRLPTWVGFAEAATPRLAWGIRTIIVGANRDTWVEDWAPVNIEHPIDATVIPGSDNGAVVALGITFPLSEAPLAVRIWRDLGDRGLEWIDVRPVASAAGRGAYLFLRATDQLATQEWPAGRYRVDVLVGGTIRRIGVNITDQFGLVPYPDAQPVPAPSVPAPSAPSPPPGIETLPVGLFAASSLGAVALPGEPGPALDEVEAWLDLDRGTPDTPLRSFVARTYQPDATVLGLVVPPSAVIRSATIARLAPQRSTNDVARETTAVESKTASWVAFTAPGGVSWSPGVYALRIGWADDAGAHDRTWHVELRPGPVRPEPVLLSATRAWARLAGTSGVHLGWTEPILGGPSTPELGALYRSEGGPTTLGCGDRVIPGGATVVGFTGPQAADLAPVTATIQFPLADAGPFLVLTASGVVPGLAVAAPLLVAQLRGPAAYGFRAGSGPDAPGATVCVGLTATR
jgi:hypothetical protein